MVEPISAACLWMVGQVAAAATVGNAATGIIGNRADGLFCNIAARLGSGLSDALRRPENHDLLDGVVAAYRRSLLHIAGTAATQARDYNERQLAERMMALARRANRDEGFSAAAVAAELMPALNPLIAGPVAGGSGDRREQILEVAANRVIDLFESECGSLPAQFRALFRERAANGANSWEEEFRLHASEAIKKDRRFEAILNASNIAELVGRAVVLEDIATGLAGNLARIGDDVGHIRTKTDKAAEDMQVLRRLVESLADQVSTEQKVALPALREIGMLYAELAPDAGEREILEALRAGARRMHDLESRLAHLEQDARRLANQGNRLAPPLAEARDALQAGCLDDADRFVTEALAVYADILDRQMAEVDETRRQMAEAFAVRAESARLRLDYRSAAHAFDEAAAICKREDVLFYSGQAASSLHDLGREFGDPAALEEAIDRYRRIVAAYEEVEDWENWAFALNALAVSLAILGERESGTARLNEAAAAFRTLMKQWSRETVPLKWSTAQNNLANVLLQIGRRESSTATLEEAVTAYRAALTERTRDKAPSSWAMTQSNLGVALQNLGEREIGSERLEEAVEAYRLALEERTRERAPLDWAVTQNNLGNTLAMLGGRHEETTLLEEAVEAYRASLQEGTRERVPLQWAITQANLGNTLVLLGRRDEGTNRLEEAVAAYRAALEEQTRERAPILWAAAQYNLGNALYAVAERRKSEAHMNEAISAYDAALLERTEANLTIQWASTIFAKARAETWIAAKNRDAARLGPVLSLALDAYREVVEAGHERLIATGNYVVTLIAALQQVLEETGAPKGRRRSKPRDDD